jgi:lipopolysaccharide transport system ATP-binding protein
VRETLAISAEGLAKRYRLGATHETFRTLRDALTRMPSRGPRERSVVWALDDVSFEVERGEAIGVIGPNGAGKTTLLKILSRVTEPTRGRALVRGRVGSLLEVGTGFHLELTGRENIFLNGAILGMRRAEIVRKLDEIVEFAEVERFLDTPVKRYSSGMYVRLAFAVAAHLDAHVLLVDEVLSVGDLAFQQKCLGKMQDQTSAEGRTVLFVSHNLAYVKALTSTCVWLEAGRIRALGPTPELTRDYVLAHGSEEHGGLRDLSDVSSGRFQLDKCAQEVVFDAVSLQGPGGEAADVHFQGQPIRVELTLRPRAEFDRPPRSCAS